MINEDGGKKFRGRYVLQEPQIIWRVDNFRERGAEMSGYRSLWLMAFILSSFDAGSIEVCFHLVAEMRQAMQLSNNSSVPKG